MVMIHIEKEYNYKGYECAIKKIDFIEGGKEHE